MRRIFLTLCMLLISNIAYSTALNSLSIHKTPSVVNGTFTLNVYIPHNDSIIIKIPNASTYPSSNIQIIRPDGISVNESNASLYNTEFNNIDTPTVSSMFLAEAGSWIIKMDYAPAGQYTITGTVTGASSIPVDINITGSSIKYAITLGTSDKGLLTNEWIPITVYIQDNNLPYTQGAVDFNIYKDTALVYTDTAHDDGQRHDVTSSDGLYHTVFKLNTAGVYQLDTRIHGIDSNGDSFDTDLVSNFDLNDNVISVSTNYIEEPIELDSNGYDELKITMPLLSAMPTTGKISTYAELKAGTKVIQAYRTYDVSEGEIYAIFKSRDIRNSGYSGQFELLKFQYEYNGKLVASYNNLKNTAYYDLSVWDRENIEYDGIVSDAAIDSNGDGVYDFVRVAINVDSILNIDPAIYGTDPHYGFTAEVYDQNDNDLGKVSNPGFDLSVGVDTVDIDIPSSIVVADGGLVTLKIRKFFLYPNVNVDAILLVDNLLDTTSYYCWDFYGCNGENNNPNAIDDIAYVDNNLDTYIDVVANDTDIDGDLIKLTSVTQANHGIAEIVGNAAHYVPEAGYVGDDTFTYTIVDVYPKNHVQKNGSATGTVTVHVRAPNNPPVAISDNFIVTVDTNSTLDTLQNDSDPDGDPISIYSYTQPQHGTMSLFNNEFVYTPNSGYIGSDSFNYTIFDGRTGYSSNNAYITVASVNHPPVAQDDQTTAKSGFATSIDVLANDSDIDGDPLLISSVSQPGNGTVSIVSDKIIYTPSQGFIGTDNFSYTIYDGRDSATANVSVDVAAVIAPVVTITSYNNGGPVSTGTVTISGTVADPDATVLVNGVQAAVTAANVNATYTATIDINNSGTNPVINVVATGSTGLQESASITLNKVDFIILAGQSVSGTHQLDNIDTKHAMSLQANSNTPSGITFIQGSLDQTTISGSWLTGYTLNTTSSTQLGYQSVSVTYNILDRHGNVIDTQIKTINLYIKQNIIVAPEISAYFPTENATVKSYTTPVTVQIVNDTGADVTINGITASQLYSDRTLYTSNINLVSGLNTINVSAQGNNGGNSTFNYLLTLNPTAPPTVSITSHTDGDTVDTSSIVLTASYNDFGAELSARVNDGESITPTSDVTTATWNSVNLVNGSNTIKIYEKYYSDPVAEITINYAPPDIPPIVNIDQVFANPNGNLVWETDSVELDGAGSTDPDGSIVSYSWKQLTGTPVTISGTGPTITITMPHVDADENVEMQLTVTDNLGVTSTGTYTLTNGAMRVPNTTVPTLFIKDPTTHNAEWHIDFYRENMPGKTYFRLIGDGKIVKNSNTCGYTNTTDWQWWCENPTGGGVNVIIYTISKTHPFSIEYYSVSAEGHTETVKSKTLQ